MRLGVRTKLFLISFILMLFGGGAGALYLEGELRRWMETSVEENLVRQAQTIRQGLEMAELKDLQAQAMNFARVSKSRVTLVAMSGKVLADSELSAQQLAATENHAQRPEIVEAHKKGLGLTRRHSTTVDTRMMYAAVPLVKDSQTLTVRTAISLQQVEEAVRQLRALLAIAAVLGLFLAMVMSWLASYILSRALGRLTESARKLPKGEGRRLDVQGKDEIDLLAGSFNKLADELEVAMSSLATERAHFETVLQCMSEAVLVLDSEQTIILVNPETLSLLELKHNPGGSNLLDAIKVPALSELAQKAAEGPAQAEFPIAGEKERRVLARATPLTNSSGVVIVMHDVTEMRRLENIRKDFVANVSHELRTPVSIVRANAETLLDGALDDPVRARTFVEALHRNSERLSLIIADLLDLSRLEAGRYQFEISTVRVEAAIHKAIDGVQTKADNRKQSIELSVPEDQKAMADVKALDQVLLNLLDNSIKYTPEGGHVAVRVEERGEEVRIEVQDDGPGIKAEHRARIFERFYRIDPGRSRDMGGTGLGLAIVKHFVESMGGQVGVDPAFPRGSVFWITLPLSRNPHAQPEISESAVVAFS